MSPEIKRAALRAAAKAALVAALGCGGDPKPAPRNATPVDPPQQVDVEVVDASDPVVVARKAAEDAVAAVARLTTDLEALDRRVGEAVDEVVAAQTDADRAAAKAKLDTLRKDKLELERQIEDARQAAARARHAVAAISCMPELDKLAQMERGALPDSDPLKSKPTVYGAFADRAARNAPETQRCCNEEIAAYGSNAKHRWACCSALPALPADAEKSACMPWGPPCPPAMV